MKNYIMFFCLIILSDSTFAKNKKVFTPSIDLRITTEDNADVPSFAVKGIDSSGNQFASGKETSQKTCILYEVLRETVIDDVEEYSEGKVGFQFLNCPYSEIETKFTISSQKEQKISVSSKIDFKVKTPLVDAYDELDMLNNQSADYTVKINTTDPSKSTIEKQVSESTLEIDLNLCLDQKYFVKFCKPTNKFNIPDECVIGSEPTPIPNPAPIPPGPHPTPNPVDGKKKTLSDRIKDFIANAKLSRTARANEIAKNKENKTKFSADDQRCTMNNVCYMGAAKDLMNDIKAAPLAKKKTLLLKLDLLVNNAAEKKEIKDACISVLKKDIGILYKKY